MPLMRGAFPSPRHKLAATPPHIAAPAPQVFSRLAAKLSFWGNNVDGDCVSAEEAAAKAADGIFMDDSTLIAWARKHGWLNGANLTDVMDAMISEGIMVNGVNYKDGPYRSVDWTDYATLCSAIYQGSVKVGVAAAQLEAAATPGRNGWIMLTARHDGNIDHCTNYAGYGPLSYCCAMLGVEVPSGIDPNLPCLIKFTWDSYGILSHDANKAICGEAWLRNPTTVGISPNPAPDPIPVPTPVPTPGPGPSPRPCPRLQQRINEALADETTRTEIRAIAGEAFGRPLPDIASAAIDASEAWVTLAGKIGATVDDAKIIVDFVVGLLPKIREILGVKQ